MISYVECEEFDIKHEDDPLAITEIKTESQDMKCEIKMEPKDCEEIPDDADVKDQIIAEESQLVSTMKTESEMLDTSDFFHIVHKNNEIKEEKIEVDETNPITEDAEYLAKSSHVAYTDIYYECNTSREELQTCNVTNIPVFQHNEAINDLKHETADKSKVENYNAEKYTQTGQNRLKCDICNKTFLWKSSIMKHLNSHNSVRHFSCDICRKSFSRKSYLTNHLQVHDPVKTYTCNVCSRSFIKRSFLTKHLYVHSVEKRYMCDICNKSFSWKFHLDKHKHLHDGQKSLSCRV